MRRTTRIGALVATTGLLSAALWAPAATADIDEPFGGSASGELLRTSADLGAVSADLPTLAELALSTTEAQADSPDGIDGGDELTRGYGLNLSGALADEQLPNLVEPVEQTAPPDNEERATGELINLDQASPLVTGQVLPSTAWARDPAAIQCPDQGRTTVSEGESSTTNLGVIDLSAADESMGSLISVTDLDGNDTLASTSGVYIGTSGEVIGESNAPAVQINIAEQLDIEVVDPVLTATATGTPGGASVEYRGQVLVDGEEIVGTSSQTIELTALEPLLGPLDELLLNEVFGPIDDVLTELVGPADDVLDTLPPPLGDIVDFDDLNEDLLEDLIQEEDLQLADLAEILQPTVDISVAEVQSETADDGTSASGSVDVVSIDLTIVSTLLETPVPLVALDLMPLEASANVEAGGIDCGLPSLTVDKDGPATVQPGDTFEYTIDVTNATGCDVTDVVVTDEIQGPDGFEVTGTDPEADSVDGGTVSWEGGSLESGESATYVVMVRVPEDAAGESFSDTATATGNCDGQGLPPGEDTLDGPEVQEDLTLPRTDEPEAPPAPEPAADELPETGGGAFALLGLGALVLATRLRGRA